MHRVLKIDPDYSEAWYNLASIARRRGETEPARRYLDTAIAADPLYPDPVYNLALLDFEEGNLKAAQQLWTRYIDLDPDSTWAQKARRGLHLIKLMAGGDSGLGADAEMAIEDLRVI